ncbi:MAG: hypothetical protein AAF927_30325 [Bacteroidota bacterium]
MRQISTLIICLMFVGLLLSKASAQVFTEKQSRHRFAQLVLGADARYLFRDGNSAFLDDNGDLQTYELGNSLEPRLTISGLHFWGYAEFYVSFPISGIDFNKDDQVAKSYSTSVETGARVYPTQIEQGKIAPYLGLSFNNNFFRQRFRNSDEVGPAIQRGMIPLHAGLIYNHKSLLFEAGLSYFGAGEEEYYVSRTQSAPFARPRLGLTLGAKWFLDTTVGLERAWESGKSAKQAQEMMDRGELNGLSVSVGPSSAFSMARSSHNERTRPWLDDHAGSGIFVELGLGYYLAKPDLHFNLAWRRNASNIRGYGVEQSMRRQAFTLEAFKFLGDYHGFVPYIGPTISYEMLGGLELDRGNETLNLERTAILPGIIFGWDIRPNDVQTWLLRTNLRYAPFLTMDTPEGNALNFSQLEFNFITFVYYPGRAKRIKRYR